MKKPQVGPSARASAKTFKPYKAPRRSPWGKIDHAVERAPGIVEVSTPGHGGIKLSPERNRAMPESVRRSGGWYEEDVDWSLVVMVFPEAFTSGQVSAARDTARHWLPERYMALTGETLTPETSRTLARRAFEAETNDRFVVRSASSFTPSDTVRVSAFRASDATWKAFLVDADEYAARGRFGFVVDESRHAAVEEAS